MEQSFTQQKVSKKGIKYILLYYTKNKKRVLAKIVIKKRKTLEKELNKNLLKK